MNRRAEPRIKKRISCELTVAERQFRGVVLDLSSHGLFVQTAAKPDPGQTVALAIAAPGRREPLVLEARVARAKLVPPKLRAVAQGGVGLHIEEPPEEYRRFVEEVQRPVKIAKVSVLGEAGEDAKGGDEDASRLTRDRLDRFFSRSAKAAASRGKDKAKSAQPKAGPYTQLPRWRVQLRQVAGPATRSFIIRCGTEAEVRDQAMAEVDDDWKIEGIEKL
jgi:hypothetical protein